MEDFPKNIKDVPGYAESPTEGLTVDGKTYNWGEVSSDPALRAAAAGRGKLYKTESGAWTVDPIEAISANLSLDKKTGTIKVSAPKSFTDSEFYKNELKPQLLEMSRLYKLDHKYKYAMTTDENNTKTTEDWLKEMNKEISKQAKQAVQLEEAKEIIKQSSGVTLNNSQLTKTQASTKAYKDASGQTVQVKDTDAIAIPKSIREMSGLASLSEYDDNTHMTTVKAFKDAWDREKVSDADIVAITSAVDEYFEKGDFSDADEYAEMLAFADTIGATLPHTGIFREIKDFVVNSGYGILTGTAHLAVNINTVSDTVINTAGSFLASGWAHSIGKEYTVKEEDKVQNAKVARQWLESIVEQHKEYTEVLNPAMNFINTVGYEGVPIIGQIAIGAMVGSAVGGAASGAVASLAGKSVAYTAETLDVINTSRILAEDLTKGTEVMLKLQSVAEANASIAGAVKTLTGTAGAITAAASAAASVADLAAQTTVDAALMDPVLFQNFMEGNGNEEEKAYMLEQVTQNVVFWGLGIGASKAIKEASNTTVGVVVNAATASKISWAKVKIGKKAEWIRTLIHGGDSDWMWKKAEAARAKSAVDPENIRLHNKAVAAERKATVLEVNRSILRKADENISELKTFEGATSWDEIVERAYANRKTQADQLAMANELADYIYNSGTAQKSAVIAAKYTTFRAARSGYLDSLSKVIKAEKAAGITTAKKILDAAGGLVPAMSKETNDYVNAVLRVSYLNPYRSIANPNKHRAIDKELEKWNGVIDAFRAAHIGDGLVEAADDLVSKARELSREIGKVRVGEKVLNEEVQASRNAAKQWEAGYVRQQRTSEFAQFRKRREDVLKVSGPRDYQKIEVGSTEDFADISWVLFDDINDVARQALRKDITTDLKGLGYEMKYAVTGDEVKLANEVTPVQDSAIKAIQRSTDTAVKDLKEDVFIESFKYQKVKTAMRTAEEAETSAGAKVAAAKAKDYAVSDAVLRRGIMMPDVVPDDLVEAIVTKKLGKELVEMTDKDFQKFEKKASAATKRLINSKMPEETGGVFSGFNYLTMQQMYNQQDFLGQLIEPDIAVLDQMEKDVYRSLLATNYDGLYDFKYGDKTVRQMLEEVRRAKSIGEAETVWKDKIDYLEKLKKSFNLSDMKTNITDQIDDIIDNVVENNAKNASVMKALTPLADDVAADDMVEYVTLRSLADKKNLKKITDKFYNVSKMRYNEILTTKHPELKKSIPKISKEWAKVSEQWLEERIVDRYGEMSHLLSEAGSPIVDQKDIFQRVNEINAKITGAKSVPNVIKTYSGEGFEEYIELSPTIARMITTRPNTIWRGKYGQIEQRLTRVFRFGTTGGLVPSSLINQGFKDPGLAFVPGGAIKGNRAVEKVLAEEFGETFAKYYSETVPDLYETLMKGGEFDALEAARYETDLGRANVDTQLESRLYSSAKENYFQRNADGIYDASVFEGISARFDEIMDKAEFLNNVRETYLRQRVYNNNLLLGLRQGMSLEEARSMAKFVQANATTNFGRWIYHFTNLQQTVPYLGAAINGTKSFYRLLAFDPVGVTTRFVGGYLVPIMAITNYSLQDEENRRIYKQIPEYEKDSAFVFVYNGQKMAIPVPQELGKWIHIVQNAIEDSYDANEHGFNELMFNDLVAFFPYDLTGFVNIDRNPLTEDDMWASHIFPGVARVANQMLTPIEKSAVIAATGIDPYTMSPVDTSYVYVDPETGTQSVMGSKAGNTASAIGGVLGKNVSAGMAQSILNTFIGKGNAMILDGVVGLAQAVVSDDKTIGGEISNFIEAEVDKAVGTLTVSQYDERINQMWKKEVSRLYRVKEALMDDDYYVKDLQTINSTTATDKAKNEAKSRVATKQEEYQNQVLSLAQRLTEIEGGTLDENKFASVLALMTFSNYDNQNPNDPSATALDTEEYFAARAAAVETMARMGFTSPSDFSVFGYYKQNKDGSISLVYNNPISMLDYKETKYQQSDIHLANIQSILKSNEINRSNMFKDWDSMNASQKKEWKKEWNTKVATALRPYVNKYGINTLLSNSKIVDLLGSNVNGLLFIKNPWKTKDYLKEIFK